MPKAATATKTVPATKAPGKGKNAPDSTTTAMKGKPAPAPVETPTEAPATEAPKEPKEKKEEKAARLGWTGNEFTTRESKKEIRDYIASQVLSEVNGITVGALVWTVEIALYFLRLMTGEGVQRPIQWQQATELAGFMRNAAKNEDVGTRWYDGTNLAIIADNADGIDSRHRNIAFVLAFGTRLDLEKLMRIVSGFVELTDEEYETLDPTDYAPIPVTGWIANQSDDAMKIDVPQWCLPVAINTPRAAFQVLDTQQAKRTGADMLITFPESSRMLSESTLKASDVETALRLCYLRTNFKTNADGETVMGSLKVGGAIHPGRYPIFSHIFAGTVQGNDFKPGYICLAHTLITQAIEEGKAEADATEGATFVASRLQSLGYYNVLAACALALQMEGYDYGDENESNVYPAEQLVSDMVKAVCNGPTSGTPAHWLVKYLEEKEIGNKKKSKCFIQGKGTEEHFVTLKPSEMFTALVLAIVYASNEFPTVGGFIQACQDEYTYRLESPTAWDSNGLPFSLLQAAELAVQGKTSKVQAGKGTRAKPAPKK